MRDLEDPIETEIFLDCFEAEIESWHTSSLCCCQFCYEEYCRDFPAIYPRLITIDLSSFWSQTNLCSYYTEEEYEVLIKKLECPNCYASFKNEVYAFELPFKPSYEFNKYINEMAQIGSETPFMLYSHPYAKKVFEELEVIFKETSPAECGKLYRGRILNDQEISVEKFSFPPADKTSEGRYNHSGIPVLYLACDKKTCYYECGGQKENFYFAEFEIKESLMILDLTSYMEDKAGMMQNLIWSSLLSAPKKHEGWQNPQYTFSRFLADCANFIGFHGIKYPSVAYTSGENIVLFKPDKRKFVVNEFSTTQYDPYQRD